HWGRGTFLDLEQRLLGWDSVQPTHYLRALELSEGKTWDVLVSFPTRANGARLPALFHQVLSFSCHFGGPLVTAGFLTLCQLMVCPIIIILGRSLFGRQASYCAAALFALSPSLVSRSQTFANELMAMPLACLYLFLLLRARKDSSSSAAGWAFAAATALGQIHLSGLFTLVLTGPLCLFFAYKSGLRRSFPGLLFGFLILLPFATHEIKHDFRESRRLVGLTSPEEVHSKLERKKASHLSAIVEIPTQSVVWFGSSWTLEFVGKTVEAEFSRSFSGLVTLNKFVEWLLAILGLAAFLFALSRRGTNTVKTAPRFVALLLSSHWLVYWVVNLEVDPYYMLIITPHVALLLGTLISHFIHSVIEWTGSSRKIGLAVISTLSGLVLLTWITTSVGVMNALHENGGNSQSFYGPSYRTQRDALRWVISHEKQIIYIEHLSFALSLDIFFREFPEESQRQFKQIKTVLPFWEIPYRIIFPKKPRGPVSIIDHKPLKNANVLAQFGQIYVIEGRPREKVRDK
ncbi:MAG: glycosyltransferase family 39 protein, partial [Planctomycetota bacterium]|nr:glycosyltransferase family 39 protein [Planctomycetota bacterium]